MPRTYVAIDVETTGLDPTQDEIIEVAALRFTLDGPGEHFATLVKARKPIPMQIELLTGIRQHELATAPPFAAIAGDLLAFIGDAAIVAQNAPFDIGFLAAAGLHFTNPVLDTLELARILAPQLTERNLTALALHFGVDYGKAHRALADATATAEVFRGLRRVAVALDPRMVYTLTNLGGAAPWKLNTFFQEVFNELVESGLAVPAAPPPALPKPSISVVDIAREGRPKDAAPAAADLDVDLLAHLLGPEGPVAAAFAGYEHRPEQVGLMRSIAEAFNVGEHLLAEAGTGTGKSMAYLLPALVHALQSNQPVVVSTATIALQEQIVTKDIPLLLRALSTVGGTALSGNLPDFSQARYTHLKGRSNYLCQRRWQGLASSGNLDAAFMARLTVWLGATQTGDRAELQLNSFESGQWARVAATSENCPASQCMTLRNGECFLQKARQRAAQSHLIVVNHALLVSDIASGGNVLPGYNYLIIDEAHHLEDVATDQLGYQANYDTFASFLDRLSQDGGGRANGFLPSLQVSLRTAGTLAALHQGLLDAAGTVAAEVPAARQRVAILFGLLSDFLNTRGEGSAEYGQRLRLTRAARHAAEWDEIDKAWEDVRLFLQDARQRLDRIHGTLEGLGEFGMDNYDELLAEAAALCFTAEELEHNGSGIVGRDDSEWVSWLSASGRSPDQVTMCAAPIEVGPVLQRDLFSRKTSVVMTSATLRTNGSFDYMKTRLGFEDIREESVESSFPYQEAALLLLPQDVPDPQNPRYTAALSQALVDLCAASDGRALVLFTSYGALQTAFRTIRPILEPLGFKVLAQGSSGTPHQMLTTLRREPRTVLLGTASFWEGVDVVGEALSLLVITRFPFTVPTEPVFAARAERFEDSFKDYAVPQAVLRFRQGFGRLIRSHTDRGVCVVLDARALTKSYGATFIKSLPPAAVRRCLLREAPMHIRDWLAT